eukprot:Em0427g2a
MSASQMLRQRKLPPVPGGGPPVPGGGPPPLSAPSANLVDFLLPTGVFVRMPCSPIATLRDIKQDLFKEAKKYPFFNQLKDQGFYNFLGVTMDGQKEEFLNDNQTLDDLELFLPILKLVEKQGDQEEKMLNAEIGNLIGYHLHDFDVMGPEVQATRRNLLDICEQAVVQRNSGDDAAIKYLYPPNLMRDVPEKIQNLSFDLDILFMSGDSKVHTIKLTVASYTTPSDVVALLTHPRTAKEVFATFSRTELLVLKVVGKEEYLLDEHHLFEYKYIADCLMKEITPKLSLKPFKSLIPQEKTSFIRPVHAAKGNQPGTQSITPEQCVTTWELKEMTYTVRVNSAKNINPPDNTKVYVRAAVYHGGEAITPIVTTAVGAPPDAVKWNENLDFETAISDFPQAAKLCFLIFGATDAVMVTKKSGKQQKKRKEIIPIAWVNMNIFDYSKKLQTGQFVLYAWPVEDELEESVNFMGSSVLNSSTSETVPVLEVEVRAPNVQRGKAIVYPLHERIEHVAREASKGMISPDRFSSTDITQLTKLIEQDPLAQLDDTDKENIWKMRSVCFTREEYKNSLPKVLQSATWNKKEEVAQCIAMLKTWPKLTPECAMELLDYQYPDTDVRKWAVECLKALTDEELHMYLLQLVQVLKFEPYLDSDLGSFLLRRGLKNKTIGHYLFWHLRSEMHLPVVSVRFGLLLEAYCRGCGSYLRDLSCQLGALNRMKDLSDHMQADPLARQGSNTMKEIAVSMQDFPSPLDPTLNLDGLIVEKCKVMDSKMKPLWLVFENQDAMGDGIFQIFKNGDDLRLRTCSPLYHEHHVTMLEVHLPLDLRMCPYRCLATGNQVGMIEVVLDSWTIAKIQRRRGARGAFDHKLLYQWLKEQNPDPASLEKAVDNFTYSCAGCCVATYVLGIGDRHSDNIMLKKNGQLVHIDFGHFLGNFKSKFGVKLGGDKNSPAFLKFKKLCEDAFIHLRKHGVLFINLFTMMLSTGIPELKTTDDIMYIKEALCLGQSDDVALENFRKKLQEAIRSSWSVSLNWYFHMVKRNPE